MKGQRGLCLYTTSTEQSRAIMKYWLRSRTSGRLLRLGDNSRRFYNTGCQVYVLKTLVYSVVFRSVWICRSPIRLFQTISLPMGNLILCIKFSSADYPKIKGEHSKEKLSKFPHFIVVFNSLGKYSKFSNFLLP